MPKESFSAVEIFYPRFDRDRLVALLRERLAGLTAVLPVKHAVLFGSWANGKATPFSDIDLLVIYDDPPREDAYKLVWQHLDLRGVEPHVYSEREAEQRQNSLDRMTQGGVVLFPS